MREFVITTDNNSDLPESYLAEHQVGCAYLSYSMDGVEYSHGNFLPVEEFYDRMRKGSLPTTAQVNPEVVRELFEGYLKEGKDVLHLSFSSGLSGSYNACRIAAEELSEEYPDRTVEVIDTLNASLGQGLVVHEAVKLRDAGKSREEISAWLREHLQNFAAVFTVDDLNHLYRGGRVSKATAVVGGMLNIKPVLHVDEEGKLVPVGKSRGRKKSLLALVEEMESRIGSYGAACDTIFLSHGDCLQDAQFVAEKVKEKHSIQTVIVNHVGATIGAHSGPGTVALFFLSDRK